MRTFSLRLLPFGAVILLLLGAATVHAQEGDAVTPLSQLDRECPYPVKAWADQQLLPLEELEIASTTYTMDELFAYLRIGHPEDRDSLPLLVRLAQELISYRMNVAFGFTPWTEADLVGSQSESFLRRTYGGLPPAPEADSDQVYPEDTFLPYMNEVLANYNLCNAPVF